MCVFAQIPREQCRLDSSTTLVPDNATTHHIAEEGESSDFIATNQSDERGSDSDSDEECPDSIADSASNNDNNFREQAADTYYISDHDTDDSDDPDRLQEGRTDGIRRALGQLFDASEAPAYLYHAAPNYRENMERLRAAVETSDLPYATEFLMGYECWLQECYDQNDGVETCVTAAERAGHTTRDCARALYASLERAEDKLDCLDSPNESDQVYSLVQRLYDIFIFAATGDLYRIKSAVESHPADAERENPAESAMIEFVEQNGRDAVKRMQENPAIYSKRYKTEIMDIQLYYKACDDKDHIANAKTKWCQELGEIAGEAIEHLLSLQQIFFGHVSSWDKVAATREIITKMKRFTESLSMMSF